jgi:hypothetical protein
MKKIIARYQAAAQIAAREYDLSEGSYRRFWAAMAGLDRALSDEAEKEKILDKVIAFAARRELALTEDIWGGLRKSGAVIQPIYSDLVQPEPDYAPIVTGSGAGVEPVRGAPKMKEVVTALKEKGIFADDLFIYRGLLSKGHWRKHAYAVIEIRRIQKQIAVSDEVGQVVLVSPTLLPIEVWAGSTKKQLQNQNVHRVEYRSGWTSQLMEILLGIDGVIDPTLYPKQELRRVGLVPLLTEEQIVKWIKLFFEKTTEETGVGRYPSEYDREVWDKNENGQWKQVEGETWKAIAHALYRGHRGLVDLRGSSVPELRKKHGFTNDLTEEQIVAWIKLFYEKSKEERGIGRYPTPTDKDVWSKNEDGIWKTIEGESWGAINDALCAGYRGLQKGSSLSDLKKKHGLANNLTEERIAKWITLIYEKTKEETGVGRYPTADDSEVWDKDREGKWIEVKEENWAAIDATLRKGGRGLDGVSKEARSLSKFIQHQVQAGLLMPAKKRTRWSIKKPTTSTLPRPT